jgi:hypothetical protein
MTQISEEASTKETLNHSESAKLFSLFCECLLERLSACPVTVLARRYSDSTKANFDIYLPEWLAKYNKLIYTLILIVVIFITVYQLFK